MKRIALVIAAAVALAPLAAAAHGPVRQKVTETVEIAAPPAEVWARVGNFDDMSWLPLVVSTEAPAGNTKGDIRTLTIGAADGPKIVEELAKYDAAKMTYSYRINEVAVETLPVTNYASTITVKDGTAGGSLVEWRGAFYRGFPNNNPPPELNDEAALAAVTQVYRTGLDALKAELEKDQLTRARALARAPGAPLLAIAAQAALAMAAPAAAAEIGFITNQSANSVWEVDLSTGEKLREWSVPGAPAGVAIAPSGHVYVTSPENGAVTAIDPATGVLTTLPLGGGPLGITVNPATGALYVADWYADGVTVLRDGLPAARVTVGHSPSGLAATPDGALLLSADRDSDQVSVIDTATLTRVATIPVGIRPFGITIDADGARAYAANVGSDSVSVIDLATRSVIATVPTGERPYKVALTPTRGFVSNSYGDSVTAFDLASLTPLGDIDVGEYPEGIEASRDGARVYVSNWFSNTLSVIDPATLAVTREIAVGDGPRAFGDFIHD